MDAWATVSHHLDYKQQIDIPRELKADFNALAGLFYVADTHFEMYKKEVTNARESLGKTAQKGEFNLNQEINFESLAAYMQWKFPERRIVADNLTDLGWSLIIKELNSLGYKHLHEFENKTNTVFPMLKKIEQREFVQKTWKARWAPDGLIRTILDLTDDNYVKRHGEHFNKAPRYKKATDDYQRYIALLKETRSKLAHRQ
jgi:hypothetical protein